MPILGVVVTHPHPSVLLAALADNARVTRVGTPVHDRLPLVLAIAHHDDDRAELDALAALPGVLSVDLAFADFSDEVQK
jgi:hypothetical protein